MVALQAASRAISNRELMNAFIDQRFLCETGYHGTEKDEYPYRVELDMELMHMSIRLNKQLAKLAQKEFYSDRTLEEVEALYR